jgi:hypothetical protein
MGVERNSNRRTKPKPGMNHHQPDRAQPRVLSGAE